MTDGRRWVLDRIEDGEHAVLLPADGESERVVPLSELPPGAREGDALCERAESLGEREGRSRGGRYRIDREATERLREEADELRASLRRGPSGPVSL